MYRNNGRNIAERLVILRDYLFANADRTHAVKMEEIQSLYEKNSFEGDNGGFVSIKTVYRDLETLRDIWGIETRYVEKYKGYILENPPFEANEMRLIVDSVQASKFITQRRADALTKKIINCFGNGRRQNLNRQAFVYDRVRSQNESVVDETALIYEAMTADRKISFRYFHLRPQGKAYSNDGKPIIVSPFALYWNGGNLYLYAYDGKLFRYYRVDRMERIRGPLLDEREGKDLYHTHNLTHQKAKVFQMYSGREYTVKIRFRNELTDAVIDQFGRDLMLIPEDSEHFTITAPVEVSPTFFAWIATFGHSAKIINPPEVVERMGKFLQDAMDMCKNDGNT